MPLFYSLVEFILFAVQLLTDSATRETEKSSMSTHLMFVRLQLDCSTGAGGARLRFDGDSIARLNSLVVGVAVGVVSSSSDGAVSKPDAYGSDSYSVSEGTPGGMADGGKAISSSEGSLPTGNWP